MSKNNLNDEHKFWHNKEQYVVKRWKNTPRVINTPLGDIDTRWLNPSKALDFSPTKGLAEEIANKNERELIDAFYNLRYNKGNHRFTIPTHYYGGETTYNPEDKTKPQYNIGASVGTFQGDSTNYNTNTQVMRYYDVEKNPLTEILKNFSHYSRDDPLGYPGRHTERLSSPTGAYEIINRLEQKERNQYGFDPDHFKQLQSSLEASKGQHIHDYFNVGLNNEKFKKFFISKGITSGSLGDRFPCNSANHLKYGCDQFMPDFHAPKSIYSYISPSFNNVAGQEISESPELKLFLKKYKDDKDKDQYYVRDASNLLNDYMTRSNIVNEFGGEDKAAPLLKRFSHFDINNLINLSLRPNLISNYITANPLLSSEDLSRNGELLNSKFYNTSIARLQDLGFSMQDMLKLGNNYFPRGYNPKGTLEKNNYRDGIHYLLRDEEITPSKLGETEFLPSLKRLFDIKWSPEHYEEVMGRKIIQDVFDKDDPWFGQNSPENMDEPQKQQWQDYGEQQNQRNNNNLQELAARHPGVALQNNISMGFRQQEADKYNRIKQENNFLNNKEEIKEEQEYKQPSALKKVKKDDKQNKKAAGGVMKDEWKSSFVPKKRDEWKSSFVPKKRERSYLDRAKQFGSGLLSGLTSAGLGEAAQHTGYGVMDVGNGMAVPISESSAMANIPQQGLQALESMRPAQSDNLGNILHHAGEFGGGMASFPTMGGAGSLAKNVAMGTGIGAASGVLQNEGVNPLTADLTASVIAPSAARTLKPQNLLQKLNAAKQLPAKASMGLLGLTPKKMNLDAALAAKDLGIDLPAAALTNSKFTNLAENLVSKTPIAGDAIYNKYKTMDSQTQKVLEDIMNNTGNRKTPEMNAIVDSLYELRKNELPSHAKIKPQNFLNKLNKLEKEIEFRKGTASDSIKYIQKYIQDTRNILQPESKLINKYGIKIPPQELGERSIAELIGDKQNLHEKLWSRETPAGVRDILKGLQPAIQQDIKIYGKGNPKWYKKYKEADDLYASNARREKLEDILGDKRVEGTEAKISYANLDKKINDRKTLETIKKQVSPEIFDKIKKLGKVAETIAIKNKNIPNPSGTAATGAAYAIIGNLIYNAFTNPVRALGTGAKIGAALGSTKLLTDKRFLDLAIEYASKPKPSMVLNMSIANRIKEVTGQSAVTLNRELQRESREDRK